jgi:hypothetical protein
MPENAGALRALKTVHTIAWAFFAGCIVAMPIAAWRSRFVTAAILAAIVLLEVGVLAINGWRCPITNLAERHTADRRANFDIFLPLWLARYNKQVFGSLFVAGSVFSLVMWRYARS